MSDHASFDSLFDALTKREAELREQEIALRRKLIDAEIERCVLTHERLLHQLPWECAKLPLARRAVWGDEQFMEYVRQAGEDCREVSHNDYAHRMKVATFVDWLVKVVPLWNAWKAKQVKAPVVSERKRAEP